MRIRVTKAITSNGRYYAAGEVLEQASGVEQSLRRLYGWEVLPDEPEDLSKLTKPELVHLAGERGVDGSGTKKDLLARLQGE